MLGAASRMIGTIQEQDAPGGAPETPFQAAAA